MIGNAKILLLQSAKEEIKEKMQNVYVLKEGSDAKSLKVKKNKDGSITIKSKDEVLFVAKNGKDGLSVRGNVGISVNNSSVNGKKNCKVTIGGKGIHINNSNTNR